MKAVALWNPGKISKYNYSTINIRGFLIFTQHNRNESVKVSIYISGLPDGLHGIHIHEKSMSEISDIDDANCCNLLGGHFNVGPKWAVDEPNGTRHGHHTGDLCMNISSVYGTVSHTYIDDKISLFEEDENCVLEKTVVIHEDEDDEGKGLYIEEEKNIQSLITGNAGARLACAEIRPILDPNF